MGIMLKLQEAQEGTAGYDNNTYGTILSVIMLVVPGTSRSIVLRRERQSLRYLPDLFNPLNTGMVIYYFGATMVKAIREERLSNKVQKEVSQGGSRDSQLIWFQEDLITGMNLDEVQEQSKSDGKPPVSHSKARGNHSTDPRTTSAKSLKVDEWEIQDDELERPVPASAGSTPPSGRRSMASGHPSPRSTRRTNPSANPRIALVDPVDDTTGRPVPKENTDVTSLLQLADTGDTESFETQDEMIDGSGAQDEVIDERTKSDRLICSNIEPTALLGAASGQLTFACDFVCHWRADRRAAANRRVYLRRAEICTGQ